VYVREILILAETERDIKFLDAKLQITYRFLATNKLKMISESTNQNTIQKRQIYVLKKLNQKLATENAIITHADKGKTIVIINAEEYSQKINTFVTANNFNTLTRDPTDKYQKLIIKQCMNVK
jgi:ABC-type phosphonate transport system ATPase subunit